MPTASAPVVDALRALYEAEQDSVFRLMRRDSKYLAKAPEDVRQTLEEIAIATDRQGSDLTALIRQIGGEPPRGHPPGVQDESLLGFLSLKFLLPKLVDEKKLCVRRYDNTLRAIEKVAPPPVTEALRSLQKENGDHLNTLQRKADQVIAASR